MKVKDLIEELKDSKDFQSFKKENTNSYFAAGFFILDLKEKSEKIQLDYFIPELKRVASFEFPFSAPKTYDEEIDEMAEQKTDLQVDLDELSSKSKEIIFKNSHSLIPTKIIAILKDNKWNLTCMDNVLGMVRINLDAISGETLRFEKGSLMDFMGFKKI